MRRSRVPGYQTIITKVNVTPIIDVALVLVIILLVTAPLLSVADLPVNLPEARTREAEDERNVSITLSSTGALAIDEQVISGDQLKPALAARLAKGGNEKVLVVVRADAGAPYSVVHQILEEAKSAGAMRLAIATRQKTEAAK